MRYGLIGEKLGHSFSRVIHQKLGKYDYELKELSQKELGDFMKRADFDGINVTIPYKKAVIPYLSYISPEAQKIGAVNTVVNKDGRLYGYNTDLGGLILLIKRILKRSEREDLSGLCVLILGTGGTSLTAEYAARSLGAAEVIRVSRSGKDGALTYEEAKGLCPHFIINCTPCGMFPKDGEMPIDLGCYSDLVGVADAIYNPIRTRLVREAEKRGIPAEGGLYMLCTQAVLAYCHFLSLPEDVGLAEEIYRSTLLEKENIVLVGMPSSGKSSVGKYIADKLGMSFTDTDTEIVKREKREISEIFKTYGEAYFRSVESSVIKELSSGVNGSVIATGGGAVLDQNNIYELRANGRIFFIDRPLSMLLPTPDRPTASSPEAIKKRYDERIDIYRASADITIDGSGSVLTVSERILQKRQS